MKPIAPDSPSTHPQTRTPGLRLHLRHNAVRPLKQGHPWVFDQSVTRISRPGAPGEIAALYDPNDRLLGLGLYDPDSPLRVRVLHLGRPVQLDDPWWHHRFHAALERRHHILQPHTTACRLIHGENDGWPGLVLDRFQDVLVCKCYSRIWRPHLPKLQSLLADTFPGAPVVLRLSRNVQSPTPSDPPHPIPWADGVPLLGPLPQQPVPFLENHLHFEADVVRGQKTGFFLDQRENRARIQPFATHAHVLNLFSFNGGFSIYAAHAGALTAVDVDISPAALQSAHRVFQLNQSHPTVRQCQHQTIQADVFKWLSHPTTPNRFDLVILDPPSLARRADDRTEALAAYRWLARHASRTVQPNGILIAASCSAQISRTDFKHAVLDALAAEHRPVEILAETTHPPDHPATFAEAEYLKCLFLRLSPARQPARPPRPPSPSRSARSRG